MNYPKAVSTLVGVLVLITSHVGSHAAAESKFSELRSLLKDAVAEGKVAGGSVLVIHRGEVVFEEGFGFADLKSKRPFLADTPVVIASISKPLLGTAAFRLAERGELDLSAPISKCLPEFASAALESGVPLERAPTMIELFTHTSGLRYDSAPGGRPWYASWTGGMRLADVVKRFAAEFPFKAQPGIRYAYSGIGTDIAARILEVTTGQARNTMLISQIAKPLGMTHTYYRDADSIKRLGTMPSRYYRSKGGKLLESRRRRLAPPNTYSSSGGSIISTAPDLARWLLMIRNIGRHENKAFLAPETIRDMLTEFPHSSNARGGLFIRKKDDSGKVIIVGHTGSSGTNCWIDFEHDIIGIMLTQTRGKDIKPFRAELEKLTRSIVAQQDGAAKPQP